MTAKLYEILADSFDGPLSYLETGQVHAVKIWMESMQKNLRKFAEDIKLKEAENEKKPETWE
jgi:hypothetical protein